MPLGYVLSVREVIEYYTEREDVKKALFAQGNCRKIVVGTDAGIFGQRHKHITLSDPDQIAQMIKSALGDNISAVPKKYPAFHASITKTSEASEPQAYSNSPFSGESIRTTTKSDFVIDIDIKHDRREAFRQGRNILDLLDSFEVPYLIKFSGNAGPHIILPAELFPEDLSGRRFPETARRLLSFITSKSGARNVDGSFASPGHFLRMAYSLNEHTGLVSVPITREEYDEFHLEMAEARRVAPRDDWMCLPRKSPEGIFALLSAAGIQRM